MATELMLRTYPNLLFAYHGHSLLITDRAGMIAYGPQGLQGLYEHDVRLLSLYRFLVHRRPPTLDALSGVDANSTLGYYVCPPTMESEGEGERGRQVVIRMARFVGQGLHEDVEVANHGPTPARLDLAWELGADFADFLEVGRGQRQQEAPVVAQWHVTPTGQGELRFDYQHPQLPCGVLFRFRAWANDSARAESQRTARAGTSQPQWDGQHVSYSLALEPQESQRICLTIAPVVDGAIRDPLYGCDAFGKLGDAADRVGHAWTTAATRLETSNALVRQTWDRAVADLAGLALGDGQSPAERAVPGAGIPHYIALWGRDTLTTAGQALLFSPLLAEGTLRLLGRHLGTKDDDFYDEQSGRVPAQVRDDPLALLGLTPWLHYYGDYASPLAYLVLVGAHHVLVGDAALTREFVDPARRVLDWLDERADLDGDGFLEYRTRSPQGPKHQGWKDQDDSVIYEDGRQAETPIAPCEIQGYWYAAMLLMAEVFRAQGEPRRAFRLIRRAKDLKRRFNERFWMPEHDFLAFALDAEKRQVQSIVSNAGHCLATGIVDKRHVAPVVRRLMAPDMFSGWGIRTLSAEHPAYNPFGYHLGSVWPVENATIAFGMKRYGFNAECNQLAKAIFDAAALFEHRRLPETFGGHPRDARHPHPGIYPGAAAPQAWSASAIAWLIQAMLGLWSYAPLRALVISPDLPDWLPEMTLRNLRVRDARVSIRFTRDTRGRTHYRVLERSGSVHVVRQPLPGALGVRPITRLRDLAISLLPGH